MHSTERELALAPVHMLCTGAPLPESHKDILEAVAGRLRESRFCDVSFACADGATLHANRAFLAARCDYFACLLFGGYQESGSTEIQLPHVGSEAFQVVLDYLYSGDVKSLKLDRSAVEVFSLAQQYVLPHLQHQVIETLKQRLTLSGVGPVLSHAVDTCADPIVEVAVEKFKELTTSKLTFDNFAEKAVIACISHCRERFTEEDIFNAVLAWAAKCAARHNASASLRSMLAPLWPHLHLHLIPTEILEDKVEAPGLLSSADMLKVYKLQSKVAANASIFDHAHCGKDLYFRQDGASEVIVSIGPKHSNARSKRYFMNGRHAWHVEVLVPSFFGWVGVVDESVDMEFWAGQQKGGWMLGTNDAVCHDCPTNTGPYTVTLGLGDWQSSGVTVYLDMEQRELWYESRGKPRRKAFCSLPEKLYFAASLVSPGRIRVTYYGDTTAQDYMLEDTSNFLLEG